MAIQTKTFTVGDYAWQSWSNGYVISLTLTEESTNTANNTSLVSYSFTISNTDNNWFTSSDYSWNLSIGDQSIPISGFTFNLTSDYTTQTIASGQITVTHNADGKRDMPYSVSIPNVQAYNRYGPPAMSLAGTWTLTAIPRWATLISCPSEFADENNPQITYSNPVGNAVSELYGVLAIDGGAQDVAVREIPKTGSSYTFSLTAAERSILWNACPDSNTLAVTFYVQSTINGESKRAYKNSTLRIVNANPTLNPTVTEANDAMYALTGDRNKLVRFHSNAKVTIGASAKKGASIKLKTAQNNGKTLSSDGTFSAVESGTFSFTARDTRGNEAGTVKVTKTLIPYVKLSCGVASATLGTDGKAVITVSGNCFTGSFGKVNNSISLQYQWKTQGETYDAWQTFSYTSFASNKYTASFSVSGLDYQQNYVFQVKVGDQIEGVTTAERVISGKPVFDWGKSDFRFNVPVLHMSSDTGPKYLYFEDAAGARRASVAVATNRIYLRNYCSGTNYYEQFRTPAPGTALTASQSYELLTTKTTKDFVVAQGTSGDWTYRKWNSGAAECWRTVGEYVASSNWEAWGGIYLSPGVSGGALPFTVYGAIPIITAHNAGNSTLGVVTAGDISSTTLNDIRCFRGTAGGNLNVVYNIYVVGRWKE